MNTYLYRLPLLRQAARFIRRRIYGMPRVDLLERLPKHGICAEIGVHQGNFSQMIIDITKPRCLYLIDPWKHEPEEQFAVAFCGASVEQATMDKRCRSVQRRFRRRDNVIVWRAFSDDAGSYFSEEYLDWVYLDGNHFEAAIAKVMELYWLRTRDGV